MIKRILIALDGSAASQSALDVAASIGSLVSARLIGLYVENEARFVDLSLATAIAENISGEAIQGVRLSPEKLVQVEKEIEIEVREIRREFEEACAEVEIDGVFLNLRGHPAKVIAECARSVDFVSMGNHGLHLGTENSSEAGETITGLLRTTTRPVLVVPKEAIGESTMLIAYDGSSAAERALKAGAEFAEIAEIQEVYLLTTASSPEAAQKLQRPALDYLSAYDVEVTSVAEVGRAADLIIQYSEKVDASVVVLGAFGSTRIKELIFGSTTLTVLGEVNAAVLLVP